MLKDNVRNRRAISLIEVLVVIAIVAVLIGLLLPAVQKIRVTALRMSSTNNVKQILLAVHNYESANGQLPQLDGMDPPSASMFVSLLPFMEQEPLYRSPEELFKVGGFNVIKSYVNPADFSALPAINKPKEEPIGILGISSYPANATVFMSPRRQLTFVTDGLANTIFIAEHYSYQCGLDKWSFDYNFNFPSPWLIHRASFADSASGDVIPQTTGGVTKPNIPGLTFQVRPKIEECDSRIPQTAFESGMPCGFGDGSVRIVSPRVSESVFWSAVTPNAGDANGDF